MHKLRLYHVFFCIVQVTLRYFLRRSRSYDSETTSVKRIYICITHCNSIVIRSETNEKTDFEGHYPQNTISHCIISNETQFTLHFFQGRISAMPEIRADLVLAISKTGMCLLTQSFNFKRFTILVPSWPRFEKSWF